ncbi:MULTISPECIES: phage tail protein [unclassified Levilactobacillus]|uniref:phage tail protein n=1 Tax=unclassified Levilactobacillus TaxID=2767918 RepID=UPI002FF35B23
MAEPVLKAKDGGYIGVDSARLALIDSTTGKAISGDAGIPGADANGIYTVSTKIDGGVATANLSGLAPSVTRIWGNNAVADISVGKAQPSVAFTANFLNHLVLASVLGRDGDGKGGFDLEGHPVDLAMELISNTVAGGGVHFGFYDGYMTAGDIALATNNENETRVNDALTFTPFANDNNKVGRIYYDGDTGFEQSVIDQELFGVTDSTSATTPAQS